MFRQRGQPLRQCGQLPSGTGRQPPDGIDQQLLLVGQGHPASHYTAARPQPVHCEENQHVSPSPPSTISKKSAAGHEPRARFSCDCGHSRVSRRAGSRGRAAQGHRRDPAQPGHGLGPSPFRQRGETLHGRSGTLGPGEGIVPNGAMWEPAYDDPVFLDKLERFPACPRRLTDGIIKCQRSASSLVLKGCLPSRLSRRVPLPHPVHAEGGVLDALARGARRQVVEEVTVGHVHQAVAGLYY